MDLKKQFQPKLLVIILGITILCSIIIYLINEFNQVNRMNTERKVISNKVTLIMQLYNCNNQEIHKAILETFDPVLVAIVIGVESEYNVDAVSPTGCRGLMQLTPDKLADWQNIKKNIRIGTTYLEEQINHFGSLELAIAAYNAGPRNVTKYKGVPPYKETKQYIEKAKLLSLAFDHFVPWTVDRERQLL